MWDSADVRRRLNQLARLDQQLLAPDARHHGYRLGSPLPEATVATFEQRHGVLLPAGYREFLLLVGNGGAGPGYGLYPFDGPEMHRPRYDWWQVPDLLRTPFPHRQGWNGQAGTDAYDDPYLAAGALPIATLSCTMDILVIVTGGC